MLKENRHIILIILVAFAMRAPFLDANFSGDEVDIVGPARNYVLGGDWREFNRCDGTAFYNFSHGPVRLVIYSVWASIFGFSNVAFHFLSIAFGIAAVLVIYLIGKELYSQRVGIIAALLAAVARYHVYGSATISTDTSHFMFSTSMAVLFYIFYVKRHKKQDFAISLAFAIVSMLTKFSTVIIFAPIMAASYLYNKKREGLSYIASTVVLSAALLFFFASTTDWEIFNQPLRTFVEYSSGSQYTIQQYVMNKAFNMATVTWQLTPFLAVLFLFSLLGKKDRSFWILACWIAAGSIVFLPFQQDTQRFFLMSIAPIFLIVASRLTKINYRNVLIFAAITSTFALFIGVNDLMGYYSPQYIALFYAAAALPLLVKKHTKEVLLGGFLGLSLLFSFSNAGVVQIYSGMIAEAGNNPYPYDELWTTKDIAYYMTPKMEVVKNCYLSSLDDDFVQTNNVKYAAFYTTVPRQVEIEQFLSICSEERRIYRSGNLMGFSCKI